MLWITKYRHNKIVEEYKEALAISRENLNRKEKFEEILEKLTDKVVDGDLISTANTDWITSSGELSLPDNVPVYVDDYYGGKVIKQEATPLTVLDKNGKATYHYTAKPPTKGYNYRFHQE